MIEIKPEENSRSSHRKSKFLIGLGIIVLILYLLGANEYVKKTKKIEAAVEKESLPAVTLIEIHPNKEPVNFILPGSAEGWHMTPIWSRVNGYLIRYLVDIGDHVKEGDLLAEIDTPELDEQVAQAYADLERAIAERDIAKITNDRWERLWNKNSEAVSKQEVDQNAADYQAAEAALIAAKRNVDKLLAQQQFKHIFSPFEGIIIKRTVDVGSLIYGTVNGAEQELFQLSQSHIVRFFVDVPQNYYQNIQEGITAEVTLNEFPTKIFKGTVTRYAKALNPTSRTLLTQVDVENKENLLYPGVFARIKFIFHPNKISFIVPTTAVIIRSGYPHVAVVDGNHIVHLKRVTIGLDWGNQMEITSGLEEKDLIIAIATSRIKEGVKVEVISTKAP